MRELEAHFLEIDVADLENRLVVLGAQKIMDTMVEDRIYEQTEDPEWKSKRKRIRIRQVGDQTELTYKEQMQNNAFGGTEEIQTAVSDPAATEKILLKLGITPKRFAEKRRIRYSLDGVICDIEYWPKLPPYLEIEGPTEESVKITAKKLGLDWEKASFLDAKQIYEQIYKIGPIDPIKYLTFKRFE
jgi:adenylate cyclase, class 2